MEEKEIIKILNKIDKCDEAYYNNDKSIISDDKYDALKAVLYSVNTADLSNLLLIKRIKTTLDRVGAPIPKQSKWEKFTHTVPMGSLNKVTSHDSLVAWHKKCGSAQDLFITEKLDGISISLCYENGKLVTGATRGDGDVGENITENVKHMRGVPTEIPEKTPIIIRGEIILTHDVWKQYFPELSNPRNAANGLAKRLDSSASEYLTVISYTISGKNFTTEQDAFEYIKSIGFKIPNYYIGNIDKVEKIFNEYTNSIRDNLNYDIDGLVVRINNLENQIYLGEENHRPKGAIAYKFESPTAFTKVTNIVCGVGDVGIVTPVVEFEEVILLGAKVKRATLHNFSIVEKLGINIGSSIIVERRNDVIPYVKEVIGNKSIFKAPTHCPECGYLLHKHGEYLICKNKELCKPQIIGRLNKWVKELGILEWGEKVLIKLVESGKVKDVADLYLLKEEDLLSLERMGQKSAKNLISEIDKFREIPLENFFGGLCIDGIATSTVKLIIKNGYNTLDKILSLSVNELEEISGFGEKKAAAFHQGLISNSDRIEDILNAGVSIKENSSGKLNGKSFCFTGSLKLTKSQLQKIVKDNGGEVKKSVGKGLDYLVIDNPNSTSNKAQAARRLNTPLLSEAQFLALVKQSI